MPRTCDRIEDLYKCCEQCRACFLLLGKKKAEPGVLHTVDACSRACDGLVQALLDHDPNLAEIEGRVSRLLIETANRLVTTGIAYCVLTAEVCREQASICARAHGASIQLEV